MPVFKALHILFMFGGVAFLVAEGSLYARAIWRGDVHALAALRRLAGRRPILGSSVFLLGIAFGLLTVATGGFSFFAGWLIAAYVLVIVTLGISALPIVQKGFLGLSDKAAEAEAGQRPMEEVAQEMTALRGGMTAVFAANWILFALIILDMVLKPF
jgi:hypothetical protein